MKRKSGSYGKHQNHFHWEVSAASVIIQHMAHPHLLKICFNGVSDISTTISLIDVVKYAPKVSEL